MKKLMIAAAAAAMVGSTFAGLCDDLTNGCLAYDLKISAKTLVPKTMKCSGGMCGDSDCVTYAVLGTKTLNGFLWACDYTCEDYNQDGSLAGFNFALWEKATKTPYYTVNKAKSDQKEQIGDNPDLKMLRFDKKANKVQVYLNINSADGVGNNCKDADQTATINVTLAGTGTWDANNGYVKSASGSVAGYRTWSKADHNVKGCDDDYARLIELCDDFDSYCAGDGEGYTTQDDVPVVVYGTWTLKINTKGSKGTINWTDVVPSYCICQ